MKDLAINKKIAIWLFISAFMVSLMVLIGGLTRLTHSGLSIVEWKPITGIIPPISEKEWIEEFAKYKHYPEYNLVNKNIKLKNFKQIYLIEYIHRALGRLTGFVFLLPLLWFGFKNQIDSKLKFNLYIIFALGFLQAIVGWYMVKSGLVNKPNVSQYRLALHLTIAFVIYGLIFWNGVSLWNINRSEDLFLQKRCNLNTLGKIIGIISFFQIIIGGFVAGTNAGLIYNEFPMMGNHFIPSDIFALKPIYKNIFENPTTIQFIHRTLAISLIVLGAIIFFKSRKTSLLKNQKNSINILVLTLGLQFILGIITLIYHVPVFVALAHQFGA
ncbi:MAG: COX15/CtaA family protein, partial [Alphaproteobacteria bacterium]